MSGGILDIWKIFLSAGYAPKQKDIVTILTIFKLYEQQQYMYDNKVHKVENRIVSISQPWIRPIVRGKVKAAGYLLMQVNQQTLNIMLFWDMLDKVLNKFHNRNSFFHVLVIFVSVVVESDKGTIVFVDS